MRRLHALISGPAARWVAVAILVIMASSCASTKPIWFIATPAYVEAQIATSEDATREEYDARIRQLEAELDSQKTVSSELAALAEVISEVESSNRELVRLADDLEDRLAELPGETIREIVEILQRYLDEGSIPR